MNNNVVEPESSVEYCETDDCGDKCDCCVICNKKTNVPKNMHINFRGMYIEGAGQLCFNCYKKSLSYNKRL